MNGEVLDELKEAILSFDSEKASEIAKKAVSQGIDPLKAIEEGVSRALNEIGTKYEKGEIFLIELMMAAEASKSALKIFEPELRKQRKEKKTLGKVLIGTVEGDIHEIGKNIVAALLAVNGFDVIDLGVDVSVDTFISKVKETKPDIIGLSALLTTTLPIQKKIIDKLREEGLQDKVKVIIGGAPTSPEWAEEIGADGYGADAKEAVKIAKKLIRAT